ncbi:MAG: serine hydrolase [Bacteroidota bacterium]|nr:serine hydrolase [Bacteroidota bacterium]
MKKTLFLFLATLICVSTVSAQVKLDKRFAGIEAEINKILKDNYAAGVAVAVVEKNKVIFSKGFGYRDIANKLPVTDTTQFAIGSCTKAFTASLIGILQKEKEIDLDKPFTSYLKDFKFYSPELTQQITLRDMMSHRTGLPRHDLSWFVDPDTRENLTKRIEFMEPSAPLRQTWQYNNFMYLLQGVLTEKLTGKSWESNVESKIFSKLGMGRSNFSVKTMATYKEPALGYNVVKDSIIHNTPYYEIDGMGPAGSINSTVLDMSQWLKVWINGGKLDTVQIIPSSFVTEATSSQMIIGPGLPNTEKPDVQFSNYGFGWMLSSYKGHYRVEHGGNITGFSASTCFFPTDSIGIVVLANQDGSKVPSIVRNTIADRVLGIKYFDWNADAIKSAKKAKEIAQKAEKASTSNQVLQTTTSHALGDYTGAYSNSAYGKFEVIQKGDSLFAKLKNEKWWLGQFHYDIFRPYETSEGIDSTEKSPIRFQFNTGLNGEIESASIFNFEPTIPAPIVFKRSNAAKEISQDDLNKYTGTYLLAGTEIKTYIKNNVLFVFVPGQPEYELVAVGNNKFDFKKIPGYAVLFEMNDKGTTSSLTFKQPNGNFKATKK